MDCAYHSSGGDGNLAHTLLSDIRDQYACHAACAADDACLFWDFSYGGGSELHCRLRTHYTTGPSEDLGGFCGSRNCVLPGK